MMDETRVFEGKPTLFVTLRKYWYVNSGGGGQGKACHTATTLWLYGKNWYLDTNTHISYVITITL